MSTITMLALMAAAASAQPTYLKCTFPQNGAVLEVTADEAALAVTSVLASSGYTQRYAAAFTPTEVRFEDRLLSYVVSRVDLSIRRTIKMLGSADAGTCSVATPPKRVF